MSYSYTSPANSDQDMVRFQLSDLSPSGGSSADYAFEDLELSDIIASEGSVKAAVVFLLRVLLTDKARRQRAFSAQGVTYDDKGAVAALKESIIQWGGMPSMVVIEPAIQPYDSSYEELTS